MPTKLGARGASGVAALGLLVYSGFFKGNPLVARSPVDLTLLGVALVALACLGTLLTAPNRLRSALAGIGLALVFALGVPHMVPGYGATKVGRLYLVTFAVIVGVPVLLNTARRLRAWAIMQICAGLLLAAGAVLSPPAPIYAVGAAALEVEGSNTIATGRASGVAVVGLLILALTSRGKRRLGLAALGVAAAYPLLYSGSRGPVAATVIAVALVAVLAPANGRSRLVRALLVTVAGLVGYGLVRGDSSGGAGRVTSTLLAGRLTDTSSTARFTLWRDAWGWIETHPLGGGWGAFSLPHPQFLLLGSANLAYPHDSLLEVTGEAGWLAGIALVLYWTGALRRLRSHAADPYCAVLFGVAIFGLVNSLVSSDINDRLTWASLAAGWAVAGLPRQARPLPRDHDDDARSAVATLA